MAATSIEEPIPIAALDEVVAQTTVEPPSIKVIEWRNKDRTISVDLLQRLIKCFEERSDVAVVITNKEGKEQIIAARCSPKDARNWNFDSPSVAEGLHERLWVNEQSKDKKTKYTPYQQAHYLVNKLQTVFPEIVGEITLLVPRPRYEGLGQRNYGEFQDSVEMFLEQKKSFTLGLKPLEGEEAWVNLGLSASRPWFAPMRMEPIKPPNSPIQWRLTFTDGLDDIVSETSGNQKNLMIAGRKLLMDALKNLRVCIVRVDESAPCETAAADVALPEAD